MERPWTYYTSADTLDLDLDVNPVVLSACETAVGPGELESAHPFFWAPFVYMGLPR